MKSFRMKIITKLVIQKVDNILIENQLVISKHSKRVVLVIIILFLLKEESYHRIIQE